MDKEGVAKDAVAVMVADLTAEAPPVSETAEARPEVLIVATVVSEEPQTTDELISRGPLLERAPVAVN